mgnify:CR=1 FL=1
MSFWKQLPFWGLKQPQGALLSCDFQLFVPPNEKTALEKSAVSVVDHKLRSKNFRRRPAVGELLSSTRLRFAGIAEIAFFAMRRTAIWRGRRAGIFISSLSSCARLDRRLAR